MLINIIIFIFIYIIYTVEKIFTLIFFYFGVDNSKYFLPLKRIKFCIILPRLYVLHRWDDILLKNVARKKFIYKLNRRMSTKFTNVSPDIFYVKFEILVTPEHIFHLSCKSISIFFI